VNYPIQVLCDVLEVSRASFYAWQKAKPGKRAQQNQKLHVQLRALHAESKGTYGAPRLHAALRRQGVSVSRKRVAKLLQRMGLKGLPRIKRVRTTVADPQAEPAPNRLERQFTAEAPNRVWVTDITYIPTREGWLYMAVIMDLYARKVVGWAVADHMRTELCLEALRRAVALRQPGPGLIHHSDRGSQYTSQIYRAELAKHQMEVSMSRKGECWDNAVAESFFGTFKTEWMPKGGWTHRREASEQIGHWIHHHYNATRLHSTNQYQSPNEKEQSFYAAHQRAA
jgi:putative transposase